MNFTRSFLMAMVAVGALTLSACGKKKEEAKDMGAPAAPAPTAQPAEPVPQPPVEQGTVTGPTTPSEGEVKDPRADRGSSEAVTGQHQTGGKSGNGLVYTGSAPDETLETLRSHESALSPEQQKKNKKLAQSIENVEYRQDFHTQVATISVRLKEGKHSEIYNLISKPLVDNSVVSTSRVNSALGVRTTGNDDVSGTAQCLDLNLNGERCNNVLFTILVRKGQSKSATQILVRSSYADVYADLKENSNNPEFAEVKDFLINSYLNRDTRNKVESINMVSYEVVNGPAAVELQILGFNSEFIGFRGELLSAETGSNVNVPFQKVNPRLNTGISGNGDVRLNLMKSLGDVRLLMNNGSGKLTLKMGMRPYRNYPMDEIKLTFTRRASAVISVGAGSLQ